MLLEIYKHSTMTRATECVIIRTERFELTTMAMAINRAVLHEFAHFFF